MQRSTSLSIPLFLVLFAYLLPPRASATPAPAVPPLPSQAATPVAPPRYADGKIDFRPGSALIALTFDDGPSARTTEAILEELRRRHLHATFFVNAWRFASRSATAARQRELLLEEAADGHDIGNHTFDHARLSDLSPARQEREILDGEKGITSVLGARPYLFRPPFGRMAPAAAGLLARRGYTVVQWNLSSEDPYKRTAEKVLEQVKRELARDEGGVLLLHDTHPWTVLALPLILDAIDADNCRRVADGKPPFLIVGLDRFLRPGYRRRPSAARPGAPAPVHPTGAEQTEKSMADVEVEVAGSVTQGAKASEPAQVSLEVQAKAQADTDADALARARIAEACRAASSAGEQSPSRGASATTGAPGSPESDLHAVEAP